MYRPLEKSRRLRALCFSAAGCLSLLLCISSALAQNYPKGSKIDVFHPVSALSSRELVSEVKLWYALFRFREQAEPPDPIHGSSADHGLWLSMYSADFVMLRNILGELESRKFPRSEITAALQQAVDADGRSKTGAMVQLLREYGIK
jgi:hypothetical protein